MSIHIENFGAESLYKRRELYSTANVVVQRRTAPHKKIKKQIRMASQILLCRVWTISSDAALAILQCNCVSRNFFVYI